MLAAERHVHKFSANHAFVEFEIPEDDQARLSVKMAGNGFETVGFGLDPGSTWDVTATAGDVTGDVLFELLLGGSPTGRQTISTPLRPGQTTLTIRGSDASNVALSIRVAGKGRFSLDSIQLSETRPLPPYGGLFGDRLMDLVAGGVGPANEMLWPGERPPSTHVVEAVGSDLNDLNWDVVTELDRVDQLVAHSFAFVSDLDRRDELDALVDALTTWSELFPPQRHSTTLMSWNDMAVAARTVLLSNLLIKSRDRHRGDLLDLVAPMLVIHADWLADSSNYAEGNNHGMFSDYALHVAARSFPGHARSSGWSAQANARFARTSSAVLIAEEGTVREHSPAYISVLESLVRRAEAEGLPCPDGSTFLSRAPEALEWMTGPDGKLLPVGDTNPIPSGAPVSSEPGVRDFRATGWSVVRATSQTAVIVCGYHSDAHKHADELSLLWFVEDRPVLIDPGFPGYQYKAADRLRAVSSPAHSTVSLRGRPFTWRGHAPYGSALFASTSIDGWHVFGGKNPLGEGHIRIAALSDRFGLVAIDHLPETSQPHVANWQIHSDLSVAQDGSIEVGSRRVNLSAFEIDSPGERVPHSIDTGTMFLDLRESVDHTSVHIQTKGSMATVFAIGDGEELMPQLDISGGSYTFEVGADAFAVRIVDGALLAEPV